MTEWIITSSLLILIVLLVRRLLRGKLSLRVQYALWLVVLVRLLIPGTVAQTGLSVLNYLPQTGAEVSQGAVTAPAPVVGGGAVQTIPAEPAGDGEADPVLPVVPAEPAEYGETVQTAPAPEPVPWGTVLTNLWLAGAAAVAAALIISNLRFYLRLRRVRRPCPVPGVNLPVYVAPGLPSPCLYGFPRPAVYLTPAAAEDPAVLGHVLAHERTHYRHGDHVWAVLRGAALALHWYNPLVWLSAALSKRDGELACDEGALRGADNPTRAAYGRALLRLVTTKPAVTDLFCCATTMTAGKSGLKERIAMIARRPRTLVTALTAAAFLIGLGVGCTFTGGRSDTWEPLSDEELAWFNGDEFFNGDYLNIRNQFLSSTYETPEDINLFDLFYCGDGTEQEPLSPALSAAIDAESAPCAATVLTTAQMDAVLEEYLGLTLAETNQVGLDSFTYLPEYDSYYHFHGDTNYRGSVTFQSGERNGNLVRLTYDDTFMADGIKEVTLRKHGDSWRFVSNLAVEEGDSVPLESVLAALPDSLVDRVVVVEPGDVTESSSGILANYFYKPDYDAGWIGWPFYVARYTPAEFEQSYSAWNLAGNVFYLGRNAEWYYVYSVPSGANYASGDVEDYQNTGAELTAWLEGLAADTGLAPMEEDLFYRRVTSNLSYPSGEHNTVLYSPYYGLSGYEIQADMVVYTLILSQPATQGESGIWCVDRWYDDAGNKHLVIPESGQTMDEYYASLQAACDAGHRPSLLDPLQVALEFAQTYTGRELSLDAFTLEGPTDMADTFDLYLGTAEVDTDSPSTALTWLFEENAPLEFWGHKDSGSGPWIETAEQSDLLTVLAWFRECTWEAVDQAEWTEGQPEGEPPYGNYGIRFQSSGSEYLALSWDSPYVYFWIGSGHRIWHCTSGYDQLYARLAYLWESRVATGFPETFQNWVLEQEGDPIPGGEALAAAIDSLSWTPGEPAPEGTEGIFVDSPDHYGNITIYPGSLVYYYMDDYWNFWFQGTGEADLYALAAEYAA